MNEDRPQYGEYYWCVKVVEDISKEGEIYLHADYFTEENGTLKFYRKYRDGETRLTFSVNRPYWKVVYAAAVMDGHAVGVEHWVGEIVPRRLR